MYTCMLSLEKPSIFASKDLARYQIRLDFVITIDENILRGTHLFCKNL